MRERRTILVLALLAFCSLPLEAATARILKVLPQYLDKEGRHTLAPSLYERDAYQAYLRQHPEEISALRFNVNWKARRTGSARLVLRIELRGSGSNPAAEPLRLERAVKPAHWFNTWSSLRLEDRAYQQLGRLLAWRVTLWDGDTLLAEQKSLLW